VYENTETLSDFTNYNDYKSSEPEISNSSTMHPLRPNAIIDLVNPHSNPQPPLSNTNVSVEQQTLDFTVNTFRDVR